MLTKLISITPNAEALIGYCARVSNPSNQENSNVSNLLKYCVREGHWSIFEMAHAVIEINTTRAISPQILRHRSFSFQEFSQRYAEALDKPVVPELRRQDTKNRQNSIDDIDPQKVEYYNAIIGRVYADAVAVYEQLLEEGVAKECARAVLPLNTPTRLYMSGTIRSWIHYINLRSGNGTQKEHRDIALSCKDLLAKELPTIAEALQWV